MDAFPYAAQHICLVSEQCAPNVLPMLQTATPPRHAHLVITGSMRNKAEILERILLQRGCTVHRYFLETIHSESIYTLLEKIYAQSNLLPGEGLALNATGGTKIMALAAAEWATAFDIPVFYTDTSNDSLIMLGRTPKNFPMRDALDVTTMLGMQDYEVLSQVQHPIDKERRQLLHDMLRCALKGGVGALNTCAAMVRNGALHTSLSHLPTGPLAELLRICQQGGMLEVSDRTIVFASQEAARWCNGIWLEEYVHSILYALHADKSIYSWGCSVQVYSQGVKNEIDAVFTARNRLFMLECKTAAMGGAGHATPNMVGEENAQRTIYKIDSLRPKMGGLMAKCMLISLNTLRHEPELRSKKYDVRVVVKDDLLQLKNILQNWIKTCP